MKRHAGTSCVESIAASVILSLACAGSAAAQSAKDPLPSWNEGVAKRAIVEFVQATTAQGGAQFVPPAERRSSP